MDAGRALLGHGSRKRDQRLARSAVTEPCGFSASHRVTRPPPQPLRTPFPRSVHLFLSQISTAVWSVRNSRQLVATGVLVLREPNRSGRLPDRHTESSNIPAL